MQVGGKTYKPRFANEGCGICMSVITKESYLNYVKRILEHYDADFPNRIVQEFPFNAQSRGGFVGHLVNAWAQMYRATGDARYAHRARDLMLQWSRDPVCYPPEERAKLSVGPFISCMLVGGLRVLRTTAS